MIKAYVTTRAQAAAIVQRALEYVSDVNVSNLCNDYQDLYEIEFDDAVVMNDQEVAEVLGGAEQVSQ